MTSRRIRLPSTLAVQWLLSSRMHQKKIRFSHCHPLNQCSSTSCTKAPRVRTRSSNALVIFLTLGGQTQQPEMSRCPQMRLRVLPSCPLSSCPHRKLASCKANCARSARNISNDIVGSCGLVSKFGIGKLVIVHHWFPNTFPYFRSSN